MQFATLFDQNSKKRSDEASIYTDPETAKFAQQSDKDSCDINKLIERFNKTGLLPEPARQGFYADITALSTATAYQDSLNAVNAAQRAFSVLPANIRNMFGNDPHAFVDAMDKKLFTKEMVDAGLVKIIEAAPVNTGVDAAPSVVDNLTQQVKKA